MDYDLCVIGGGVNGVGIARDAAGRGFSVLLVEAQDLAGATSSASTKLAHGGLRYLEQYEFKMVRESLREREILLRAAPHIVWPLRFILPHDENLRPHWMVRTGLFLYDRLAGRRKLSKSEALDFATNPLADPLDDKYERGFSYTDCWADDARLVVLNAVDAFERGAVIMPRTACTHLEPTRDKKGWQIHLQNMMNGDAFQITAGMAVNAAGPWVRKLLESSELADSKKDKDDDQKDFVPQVRLVKGSHIIVPRIYEGAQAFILQQPDGRVVFTIPYEQRYTLIGTTDISYDGDPSVPVIEEKEVTYLCDAVNRSLKKKIAPSDIVSTYSGVRSLVDDGNTNVSKVTRDYRLHMEERFGPPILSVFGGKLTTYRKLAEHAVDRLTTFYPKQTYLPWTQDAVLPGGDIPNRDVQAFLQKQCARYTFLPEPVIHRYGHTYGTRMSAILDGATKAADLGQHFGDHIYEAEILYLLRYEFAGAVEDILWRRSKLGLHVSQDTVQAIEKALPALLEKIKGEPDIYVNAAA